MKINTPRARQFLAFALLVSAGIPSAFSAPVSTPRMFGANITGGEKSGTYWYPRQDDIDMAKAIGAELIRVPFKWERVQHETTPGILDAALWEPDMLLLDASIDMMEARGMRVILDMHNYAARPITVGTDTSSKVLGTSALPISEFARVWKLIADRYKNRRSIWGYDLMNEPGPSWVTPSERITQPTLIAAYQAAVNAIREVDMDHAIILEGMGSNHSDNWINGGAPIFASGGVTDPANNLIASAHCYTDHGQEGDWANGATVQSELVSTGDYPDLATAYDVGKNRVRPFVDWCVTNNIRGLVGEYAVPGYKDETNWNIVSERMLAYMRDNSNGLVSGTQWSHGAINHNQQRMMPHKDTTPPTSQTSFLPSYFSGPGTNYWTRHVWYSDSIIGTLDYGYAYAYTVPTTSPSPITITAADADTANADYVGDKTFKIHYQLPAGVSGGGGMHTRGPSSSNEIGGISLTRPIGAGHVLSFYARGTPGATMSITLGSTSNSSDIDTDTAGGATDTQTGNWVSVNGISGFDDTWKRYEIPLSSLLNSSLDGSRHVQRIRFTLGPSDNVARDIYLDSITIGTASTNTAPTVSINTSTGGSTFTVGANITLLATASDADAGDSIDFVEFGVDKETKIGVAASAPFQWTTSFATAGTYNVTATAYDSHGVPTQSAAKTLTIVPASVEVIVDNTAAEFTGTWSSSTYKSNFYATNYRTHATGTGANKMRWRPTITTAGTYQVYYWLPDGGTDRATNAPVTVYYNGGSQTYLVNQQPVPGGQWILLGSHSFAAGTTGYVELTDNANNSFVIGDAIRFYKP